jgi:hypothetical protein
MSVTHVSAAQAGEIDEKLMGPSYGFSIDQLMELAGQGLFTVYQFPVVCSRRCVKPWGLTRLRIAGSTQKAQVASRC